MKRIGDNDGVDAAEARFQRFLVKLHARKQQRIHRPPGRPMRRWLAIAAPLAVFAAILLVPRNVVIGADALVDRASSVELTRPAGTAQRVHVELRALNGPALAGFGPAPYETDQEMTDGIVAASATATPEGTPATLSRLLERHRFNWRQPLSVVCFNAWRRALPRKHDEVISLNGLDGSPQLVLRTTTTDDGELREVELTIERDSYRVVREVLVFDGIGRLELQQKGPQLIRHAAPAAAASTATIASTRGEQPVRGRVESIATRSIAARSVVAQPDLAHWRDWRFGNTAARDSFMPELRRLTGSVRQHIDALKGFAERYPGADGLQSSPAAHARFQRQIDLQYQTLRDDLDKLAQQILTLTLEPKSTMRLPTSAAHEEPAPADWSRRVDAGMTYAVRLDRLAGELRAYDDLPSAVQQQLAETYEALRSAIYAPLPQPTASDR